MNQAEVLCHSSGPWKKHKYFQKIGEGANAVYKYSKKAAKTISDASGLSTKKEIEKNKDWARMDYYNSGEGADEHIEYVKKTGTPEDVARAENNKRYWTETGRGERRTAYELQKKYNKTPIGKVEKTAKQTVAKGEKLLKEFFSTKTTVTVTSNLMPPGTKKTVKSN